MLIRFLLRIFDGSYVVLKYDKLYRGGPGIDEKIFSSHLEAFEYLDKYYDYTYRIEKYHKKPEIEKEKGDTLDLKDIPKEDLERIREQWRRRSTDA